MNIKFKPLAIAAAVSLLVQHALLAGTFSLNWSTDKKPVSYLPDETMNFTVQLLDDGNPVANKILKWTVTADDQKTSKGEAKTSATNAIAIQSSISKPGFVHVLIKVCNENGVILHDAKGKPVKFEGGAGASVEKIESFPEPADFDAFWAKQKERLAAVPPKATITELQAEQPDFQLFDVKVDCAGGKPVSGYLTKPKNAAPKSLDAKVTFHGYGVDSAQACYKAGTLLFNVNAHGIENGKDAAYYKQLMEGELKNYGFNEEKNSKPETCYFNGIAFRVMRALEFIKAQPEWNGKVLEAFGGSQGGFQAVMAAALDSSVTSCTAFKPWCCDLGGVNLGRLKGWRPNYTQALSYYDPVNFAKRIQTANVAIVSGLGDYTCPPSGVTLLYNNLKVHKQIKYVQGCTHGYDPPCPVEQIINAQ